MKSNSIRIRAGRIIYFILAILFTLCTMTQFFFAGTAIFMYPADWMKHVMFVHLFGFNLPIFMLIFAFIGSLPRSSYWQIFTIMTGIFLMYFTANVRVGLPWAATLHPVIGLLLFLLSCFIVLKSWKFIFSHKKSEGEKSI